MLDASRFAWLGLLVVSLTACGGPAYGDAWLRSFSAGRRALAAGRYADAAAQFEQATRDAIRPKDRDEARFMQARMFERLGRIDDARRTYARLVHDAPSGPRTARARFELARLAIAAGQPEGWAELEAAIIAHPSDGAARSAILSLVAHIREESGEIVLRERLDAMLAKVVDGEGAQHLAYERARSLHRSGALSDAHGAFIETARRNPVPHGNLTDDAYFRASVVAEELGDPARAIADLRELLDSREVSWFGQSYERPRYPLAQMRIAELYRDQLHDLRTARIEFRRLSETHTTSILCDDALWQEALASYRLGEPIEACEATQRLIERYPQSRYRGCLSALCATRRGGPVESSCPDYLRSQLEPGTPLPRTSVGAAVDD